MIGNSFEIVSYDERGYMIKCRFHDKTIFIIFTKKGFARGGEYHPVTQYTSIISGKMLFKIMSKEKEKQKELTMGQYITIPANTAHVAIALKDSISVEWYDGELPPFEQKKIYEPYRKLIKRNYFEDENYALWTSLTKGKQVYSLPLKIMSGCSGHMSRWISKFASYTEYVESLRKDYDRLLKKWNLTRVNTTCN